MSFSRLGDLISLTRSVLCVEDEEALCEGIWALGYICKFDNEKVDLIYKSSLGEYAFEYLLSPDCRTRHGCVRLIGNFSSGYSVHTQYVIEHQFLDQLSPLLTDEVEEVRKEAFWCVSNLVADTVECRVTVMNHSVFPEVVKGILDTAREVRLEACIVLLNILRAPCETAAQKLELTKYLGVIALGLNLESTPDYLFSLLEICRYILQAALADKESFDSLVREFQDTGALAAVESYVNYLNTQIAGLALDIIEEYFTENRAHDEAMTSGDGFSFL